MTFKLQDLTKKSKWKLTKAVPFYEAALGWFYNINNTTQDAPAGTEFAVQDKRESGNYSDAGWDRVNRTTIPATWEKRGVFFRTKVQGTDGIIFFDDLKDCIELLEQPKDSVYVLKDITTGKYYVDGIFMVKEYIDTPGIDSVNEYGNIYQNRSLTGREVPHQALKKSETQVEVEPNKFYKFSNTALSGKVFKTTGVAKQRLLMTVGYYNDTGNDMMHNYCAVLDEIPAAWKLVEYDRTTKTETVLDFDCTEYANHALELKVLTTKYGSATRSMYQKLEKAGTLDEYKHFLIFTPGVVQDKFSDLITPDNKLIEVSDKYTVREIHGSYTYNIIPDELKKVKEVLHKDFKKVMSSDNICVAIKDKYEALEATFVYAGNLTYTLIDMCTLKEIQAEPNV